MVHCLFLFALVLGCMYMHRANNVFLSSLDNFRLKMIYIVYRSLFIIYLVVFL